MLGCGAGASAGCMERQQEKMAKRRARQETTGQFEPDKQQEAESQDIRRDLAREGKRWNGWGIRKEARG